jgi:hypothetical protein
MLLRCPAGCGRRRTAASEFADEVDLVLAVGGVVLTEDLVEPDGGLRSHIGLLPRIPWKVGLGLASNEASVDCTHVVLLRYGEAVVEGVAGAAGHVLRADDGAVVLLQGDDTSLKALRPIVVVERDDLGLNELDLREGDA